MRKPFVRGKFTNARSLLDAFRLRGGVLARLLACGLLITLLAAAWPGSARAQIRELFLTLDPPNSTVQLDGFVHINQFNTLSENGELPLQPQKLVADNTGLPSNIAQIGGTLSVVIDMATGHMQLTGGDLVPLNSGNYCPVDEPANHPHGGPDNPNGPYDNYWCPEETPGQYGFTIGTGGEGIINAKTRDSTFEMNGASDVSGTAIDTKNWHLFVVESFADYVPTNAFASGPNGNENLFPATLVLGSTEKPFHNEDDNNGVPLDASFQGTLDVDTGGGTSTMHIPINVHARFDEQFGADGEYVRFTLVGDLNASGTLGGTLLPGDANRDGIVDGLDANIYSLHYLNGTGHGHTAMLIEESNGHPLNGVWDTADFNLDEMVDATDMGILSSQFGMTAGSGSGAAAVPEPTSVLLGALAALGLLLARRRRAA